MKKKSDKSEAEITKGIYTTKMTRKEVIKKSGYLAASTMIILLSSGRAQAQTSPGSPPPW